MSANRTNHVIMTSCMVLSLAVALILSACNSGTGENHTEKQKRRPLIEIKNTDEFRRIVSAAGDRLLIFDFYANWCLPCKELEPILRSRCLAKKGRGRHLQDQL